MTKPVRRILVTNDDGINAPGLRAAIKIANELSRALMDHLQKAGKIPWRKP